MQPDRKTLSRRLFLAGLGGLAVSGAGITALPWWAPSWFSKTPKPDEELLQYRPRRSDSPYGDSSGYTALIEYVEPWKLNATLDQIAQSWQRVGYRNIERIDQVLAAKKELDYSKILLVFLKTLLLNYEAEPLQAYQLLAELRAALPASPLLLEDWLYTVVYYQGVTAMRRGETDNCVHCRGACSCILPLAPAAVHTNQAGSRLAIQHFMDLLHRFPDDFEVQWLLNVAHMTLGEYPEKVEPKYLLSLDHYNKDEFNIGRFREVGAAAGVDRFNMSGGAVMEDFDNDGHLDLFVTTRDPTESAAYYHNKGDGTFEDRTTLAGLSDQLGGFNCVQTDVNNDGNLDVFISRGAWLPWPVRPSLLRNNGDGTFTDVTKQAGLLDPVNSASATWADYDNDGFLDLFICCERQPNRLYHNEGNGTFKEVAAQAGFRYDSRCAKGAAWIDYDNDGWPDLFVCNSGGAPSQLFHNSRNGSFTDVTEEMGIRGPYAGFSCWAWDYDNDGWLDIFATSYERTLENVVKGLQGRPHGATDRNKLYCNRGGKGFQDVTEEVGLDMVFAAMGSNFGDFDNDGWLDFYLGTGEPNLAMLIPNRMFKNVDGKRFVDVTSSSGTGHLQKGHGVACGDLRRTGAIDLFIQMGGVSNGDKYHNLLFQNPGQTNHWLTVKLIGKKTNRPAIGARIKATTAGAKPLTVHRHISSGSSFGGNPLQQTLGLAKADRVAELEIHWPTSGTTQVFHDVAVNQAVEVTEFAEDYRKLGWKSAASPAG